MSKPVTKKETYKFLKFLKHNEYSIDEQLNKAPARISLISLLYNSEPYRNALIKAFDGAYVDHNIFVDGEDQLIENIMADTFIAFTDEKIPQKVEVAQKPYTSP